MKILLLFCLMVLPISSYTQISPNKELSPNKEISAEAKILIEQAKKQSESPKKKDKSRKTEGFNLAITSSFTGGIIPNNMTTQSFGATVDLFNATSVELYMPALAATPKTRFLLTARFFTPVLGEGLGNSIYLPRLGYGLGFSSIIFDTRNKSGKGWTGNVNLLFGQDLNFLDREHADPFVESSFAVSRIDLGLRFNHFVSRHFAFVYGLDIGGGIAFEEHKKHLGSDGFPLEPLTSYGFDVTGIINIGLTVGLMF